MRKAMLWVVILMMSGVAFGSEPQVKKYQKQKELLNGGFDGISITWNGALQLAPRHELVLNVERPFVWDIASDSRGSLYLATGDGARIMRVDKNGVRTEMVHWKENETYSLAVDKNGLLYASVSPDGKIYRFKKNQPELFASLGVKYVWDMIFDSDNTCFVATGDSGSIYKISPDGKKSLFYQSSEVHVRTLAWDLDGNLLAGTFSNGYIYRITKKGEAFVIYDSEFQEINKICVARDGTIYAAGLGKEGVPMQLVMKADQLRPVIIGKKGQSVDAIPQKPGVPRGVKLSGIIKISPSGVVIDIWNKNTDMVQSIYLQSDQSLIVGTSDEGRLYKITPKEERTLVLKLDGAQIVAFEPTHDGATWVATSNLGKLYRMDSEHVSKGSFQSPVIDAKSTAAWGTIQWQGEKTKGCKIEFLTRAGNTEKPNDTWSAWAASKNRNGEMVIKSPNARFLQWKMELENGRENRSPIIRNVKVSYLQKNLPPQITEITVEDMDGAANNASRLKKTDGKDLSSQQSNHGNDTQFNDGKRTLKWEAEDANDDQLLFHLYYKHEEARDWRVLKKSLTSDSHTWDSRMMQDGKYRVKIVASDEKSNPINLSSKAEKISEWFVIDNSPPRIDRLEAKKIAGDSLNIRFRVSDDFSQVSIVEFSVDVEKWHVVYPVDLVCDSKIENFDFKIAAPSVETNSIVIKATDSFNNIGFNRSIVKE